MYLMPRMEPPAREMTPFWVPLSAPWARLAVHTSKQRELSPGLGYLSEQTMKLKARGGPDYPLLGAFIPSSLTTWGPVPATPAAVAMKSKPTFGP